MMAIGSRLRTSPSYWEPSEFQLSLARPLYADYLDAALYTHSLPLAGVHAVLFWHWIDAEDQTTNTAWDGGIVEASVDGGAWFQITPDGGYPYRIIANPASPFPAGTPCFSGTFDWSQVRFDLTGLSGDQVQLRFRFGSDGYVTQEGWYIDDVTIEGSLSAVGTGAAPIADRIFLTPPEPNPASDGVTVRFVQPPGEAARISLLDPSGRRLMEWSYPAGSAREGASRQLRWDGRLSNGTRAASGAYFIRLEAGAVRRTQRVLVLR